ncbi:methyltransferase domain-containing protein [Spirulina sp. CS-785/01]|uniref:methyltransferase domain-containing protein n=1 Tax=Spirulina sp. CS-785/01 TaxID=3021716 RepID=UPI002330B31E|nr:methyltransferase domain-containing protein [Spirulina sp. CS-785/01]MDB9315691.1 methyltransferase domain-containing protein [Spirulina sp. CS-785/01]
MTTAQNPTQPVNYDIESTVLKRYQEGAKQQEAKLCCPTDYDGQYLKILPEEILEKDYGCGDPTRYVSEGETVVDLGSGVGKNCYILAQKVGKTGQVIGVDFNDEMLAIARKYQDEIAHKIGYHNTKFVKGKIQDLKLDLEPAQTWLNGHPIHSLEEMMQFEAECDRLRQQTPLIPDNSVDAVISNCVLNLVRPQDKQQLFNELNRILKPGGRAIISDIVCDEDPTPKILNDPDLWSGCIAGAFREDEFLTLFEQSGFYGLTILKREETPWQVIDGIEFRSMTLCAYKGENTHEFDRHQGVIYKGPWQQVEDENGQILKRGQRIAVSDVTYEKYSQPPYADDIIAVPPYEEVESPQPFNVPSPSLRPPQVSKGENYQVTTEQTSSCCG